MTSAKQAAHAVDGEIPVLEQLRKKEVEHDDRDEAGDEAFGARAADAGRAAAAGEPLVAADQSYRAAEEEAFKDAFHHLPRVDALGGVFPVRLIGHVEELRRDDP